VEKPKLSKLPISTHFEKDAGPYLTSAIIHARNSDRKIENVSIHRLLVLDDAHLTIRVVPRHLFKLWEIAKKERKAMEIAIALGLIQLSRWHLRHRFPSVQASLTLQTRCSKTIFTL